MENNRIMRVLAVILLVACGIVAVTLIRMRHSMDYVPSDAVDNLVEILERDGIRIDREIISEKRENGTVYVFDSEGYTRTVAELLSGSVIRDSYIIPDGELLILENGDRCEFSENFSFHYRAKDADEFSPNIVDLRYYAKAVTEEDAEEAVDAVKAFLENGSRTFSGDVEFSGTIGIDGIWEEAGIRYVLCSRTIDGVTITGNLVLCTVEGEKVTAAYGTWCFFTPGTSYSAQLSDILNILFNVKKDLSPAAGTGGNASGGETVTIESITSCYSLYFFGEEENFCLIPCWQIATDTRGELIYNAINGVLYTKILEE